MRSLASLALLVATVWASPFDNSTVNAAIVAQLRTAATEVDRINLLEDGDFVFNFLDPAHKQLTGAGGRIVEAYAGNFPAVIANGMAMAMGFLGPCSLNTPHTHPRATEIQLILNGTLHAGFLVENGARFVVNDVPALSAILFPRGSVHFQANLGCEPLMFAAAFNDEDPGIQQTAQRFFGMPPDIVGAALGGLGVEQIFDLAEKIPDNIAAGTATCFQQCGLQAPAAQPTAQQQPRVSGNAFPPGVKKRDASPQDAWAKIRRRPVDEAQTD